MIATNKQTKKGLSHFKAKHKIQFADKNIHFMRNGLSLKMNDMNSINKIGQIVNTKCYIGCKDFSKVLLFFFFLVKRLDFFNVLEEKKRSFYPKITNKTYPYEVL